MPLQSLSEIYDDHVSETTDVVEAKVRLEAELNRLGLPATDPTVSKYVGVCFEEWKENYHWPVFEDMPSRLDRADEQLTGAWHALIDTMQEAVIELIKKFRLGVLSAVGHDQQEGNAGSKPVPASWWLTYDGFVSFDDKRLAAGDRSTCIDLFTELQVEQIPIEKRVNHGSTLLEAVDQMADPEIRDRLRSARHPQILITNPDGAMESFEARRRRTKSSQLAKLEEALRAYLKGCLARGSLQLMCWSSPTAKPECLPASRLDFVELDFDESTITMVGQPPILVRVYPSEDKSKNKPGPQARTKQIQEAYEYLVKSDLIDFQALQIQAIWQVHNEVMRRHPDRGDRGIGEETIRKFLKPLFEAANPAGRAAKKQ